jgi:hypothetical protein
MTAQRLAGESVGRSNLIESVVKAILKYLSKTLKIKKPYTILHQVLILEIIQMNMKTDIC